MAKPGKETLKKVLQGEEDMQLVSYERLTVFAALLILVPALVSEIMTGSGIDQTQGIGNTVLVGSIILVTASYYFANYFIARTFVRTNPSQQWAMRWAILSAIVAMANFLPQSLGLFGSFNKWSQVLGDLGFIGMGAVSAYAISSDLLNAKKVRAREVWGSIALYVIVGVTFSYVYGTIALINPDAFSEPFTSGVSDRPELIYFSFVTQMTVGFGDIIPISGLARNVVILHGLYGILYPPILIARLVNLYIVGRGRSQS